MIDLLTSFDPFATPWLRDAGLVRLQEILRRGGAEARVVGGAVRDALLGRTVGDLDLAVNVPPEQVMALLTAAGIKVVPTGLAYGTVTAVVDGVGYELTSVRRDVATEGRRAVVAFTDDWRADAMRRDFTMNALFVDAAGKLYDYVDGRRDLAARCVRFIGDPVQRIDEDVLRILRFFRFLATVGAGGTDLAALAACRARAALLPRLSAERVGNEIRKLLAAPDPMPAWRLMEETGVLAFVVPEAVRLGRLEKLRGVAQQHAVRPDVITCLAALLPEEESVGSVVVHRLRLSKREEALLQKLLRLPQGLRGNLDPVSFRRFLYAEGVEACAAALLLCAAAGPR